MFDLTIISPKRVVLEETVERVFVDGPETEYEFMSYHTHVVGTLREGKVIINNKRGLLIKKGIVKFYENKCVILVEEPEDVHAVPSGKPK